MADETTTTLQTLFLEMKGPLIVNFPRLRPTLERLNALGRKPFSGKYVKIPLLLSPIQGGHGVTETGTWNEPHVTEDDEAHVTPQDVVQPISLTPQLVRDSRNEENAWREAMGLKIEQATESMARIENLMLNGSNDALIAAINAATTDTTLDVGTSAVFPELYIGRYIDVRVRATGALTTNGSRRKITAVNKSTGIITCGDGGGNFNTATTDGIYVEGSYNQSLAGLEAGAGGATTGTFENIDRATETRWRNVDGRNGVTTEVDLSEPVLDAAEMYVEEESGETPSVYFSERAVLNRYSATHLPLQRWGGETRQTDTGFEVLAYKNKPIIADIAHVRAVAHGINERYLTFYARTAGPEWVDDDGGMWRRFNRSFPLEADLWDSVQLGWHRLNAHVRIGNLARAT